MDARCELTRLQRARADDFVAQRLPAAMTPLEFCSAERFSARLPAGPAAVSRHRRSACVRPKATCMTLLRGLQQRGIVEPRRRRLRTGQDRRWHACCARACRPTGSNEVAARVSARREVNHNYEREHRFNLWFVATAACRDRLAQVLDEIADEAECPLIRVAAPRGVPHRPRLRSRQRREDAERRPRSRQEHVIATCRTGSGS